MSEMERSTQRVLITGGAGFIGSHLAEALWRRGDTVTVVDDLSTGRLANLHRLLDQPRFSVAIDTITNKMVMDRWTSECDVVVHLAAAVGVELIVHDAMHTIETNILGTHAVLEAAARYRKKVLIASTSEIYGKGVEAPFREDDDRLLGPTTKARWSYSDSKAVDEFLGLAYHKQRGLPVVICRLFNTIGPRQIGQYGMVVPRFVQQALRGDPITVYGDGRQSRCFCNVADVVRAIISLMEHSNVAGEVFNIGHTEQISILELAHRVLHLVRPEDDPNARVTFVPYDEAYEPGFEDMAFRVPDISKIERITGWRPEISLAETLIQVRDFFSDRR